jgi:DNA polymerase IV
MAPGARPEERTILHADMDAFYASVEQLDNPALRDVPLIVGGTGGRGVVAAASYSVRRFGVRSAMPMRRALQLCPGAVVVRPRFDRYQVVSRTVFDVFRSFTPLVEGLSLDEAFLDVTASLSLHGDGPTIARAIKVRVRERTGLTVSVGVAPNKLLAKIASDLEKPDGLTVITPARVQAILDPLPVKRLPGLGRKKGDELLAAGLATLGELRCASDARLWPLFGRDAARMRGRAAGIDDRPVVPDRDEKSVSAEETFEHDVADPGQLRASLLKLADKTAARLRAKDLLAASVHIKVREHDFRTHTRQRPLVPPTQDSRVIARAAVALLDAWRAQHPGSRLRLLGVGTGELSPQAQPDLFTALAPPSDGRLDATLDAIRGRFGVTAVRRATYLKNPPR